MANNKFLYVNKGLSEDMSNHLWKTQGILDAQITQSLKLMCVQYMGNHRNSFFGPTHTMTSTAHFASRMPQAHGPTPYLHV
jgi:hypothetical protein